MIPASLQLRKLVHTVHQILHHAELPTQSWQVLLPRFDHECFLSTSCLTSRKVMSHRNAYNMVINKFGDRLYNGLVETITRHLGGIAQRIEAAQGDGFLRELKTRWDNHNKSMQMIRDILMVSLKSCCYRTLHCMCAKFMQVESAKSAPPSR